MIVSILLAMAKAIWLLDRQTQYLSYFLWKLHCSIVYIYREANMVVDSFRNLGYDTCSNCDFLTLPKLPSHIRDLCALDTKYPLFAFCLLSSILFCFPAISKVLHLCYLGVNFLCMAHVSFSLNIIKWGMFFIYIYIL